MRTKTLYLCTILLLFACSSPKTGTAKSPNEQEKKPETIEPKPDPKAPKNEYYISCHSAGVMDGGYSFSVKQEDQKFIGKISRVTFSGGKPTFEGEVSLKKVSKDTCSIEVVTKEGDVKLATLFEETQSELHRLNKEEELVEKLGEENHKKLSCNYQEDTLFDNCEE